MMPLRTIGPYPVLELVETGAFTVTYRAEQQAVGRTVLIKALKPTVSVDSPFADELLREAAVLGKLDHEGVIQIHDVVRTSDALYLVLADPRGATIDKVLCGAKLQLEQAIALALSTARAVGHLHERGVVHGALGSLVTDVTARGYVILTDLSHARETNAAVEPLVETCTPSREPGFLAPEQIVGERATPRSDVWSIGVLLYELISARYPFPVEQPRKLASQIRAIAPAPLQAPAAVARIVARCLAKTPDDRYADAREVASALEQALAAISRMPVPVLIGQALAAARLGSSPLSPLRANAHPPVERVPGPEVNRVAVELAVVLGLLVLGGWAIQLAAEPDQDHPADGITETTLAESGSRERGYVRVVARPWAEVFFDGERIDVTPIGKPVPVIAGKHFITLRHPNAPDEQRVIKVLRGQTVFLDVTMHVNHGDAGVGPNVGSDAPPSP